MSDFDKEAEREKLREQFAEDDRERESTQRMSELLLQGATMTNKHCDAHGDPIFRYDGQEFCPTCRSEGQQTRAAGEATTPERQDGAATESSSATEPSSTAAPPSTDAADARPPTDVDGQHPEASSASGEPSPRTETAPTDLSPDDIAGADWTPEADQTPSSERTPQTDASRTSRPAASHADLSDARGSLARTVTRFADEAEAADDLARAREYLAAVEDAANALEAVRNAEK